MSDQVRADWDRVRAGHPITEEGFDAAITKFISVYLDEEALTEQKLYILKAKKPYNMTVEAFHSRLKWVVLDGLLSWGGCCWDDLLGSRLEIYF